MGRESDLNAWRLLIDSERHGSISAAARVAQMEPSTAIRLIESLEASLNLPLFHRGVRPFRLTSAGEDMCERMREVLTLHRQALQTVSEDAREMKGLIRLSVPIGHARSHILPVIADFQADYPDVDFVVTIAGQAQDVLSGSIDVALTAGNAEQKGIVRRYRDHSIFIPVASPEYISRHGFPHHPADLEHHRGLVYCGNQRSKTEQLERNERVATIRWGRKTEIADIIAIREGVIAGLGIAVDVPIAHCHEALLAGTLVPILDGWRRPTIDCFVICSEEGYRIRRVRTFVEWYAARATAESIERDRLVSLKTGMLL